MFYQSSLHLQPQVLTALSQFTSLLNTPRVCVSKFTTQSRKRCSKSNKKQLSRTPVDNTIEENVLKEIKILEQLPKDLSIKEICPTLFGDSESHGRTGGKLCTETQNGKLWRESCVSAETFFENKTGFPESDVLIQSKNRSLSGLQNRELHRFLESTVQHFFFQQNRGFKTRRARDGDSIGLGRDKKSGTFSFIKTHKENEKDELLAHVKKIAAKESKSSEVRQLFTSVGIRLFVLVFFLYMVLMMSPIMSSTKNFEISPEEIHVTFEDVKGADEGKEELADIVAYLKNPQRYTSLGAKLPKGVLLVGQPGNGKTLLARAVAGEAGVPFFYAAGAEFDELFVGLGSKRVRGLFERAKEKAPCVIFLDEIDSVGGARTSTLKHPYANQTINQLLSEMDGFKQNEGIIVIGATNRPDNLDQAILRPGRFDVQVKVSPPDLKGRMDILELYLNKVKADKSIDVEQIAKLTAGFTGADLENVVNQAALNAAKTGADEVNMEHIEYAKDKVMMGPAAKSRIPDEKTNWNTAYHEAGHAIVAYFTKDADPVHKVTIIPRGQALGFTAMLPEKENYGLTKSQILAKMDVCMGGRIGEEVIFGSDHITTGASNDFESATLLATKMVKEFGMSDKVGVRVFKDKFGPALSGSGVSPEYQAMVDNEIARILQESYSRAKKIIKDNAIKHKNLAKALMSRETLDKDEIKCIMEGRRIAANKTKKN